MSQTWAHLYLLIIKKDILILGKGLTLDNTTLTVEAEYSINLSEHGKKCCLSLHYNGGQ